MHYRIEEKFLCSELDYHLIKSRISELMEPDTYGDENHKYTIRSIYFDDIYKSCYQDNEDGIDLRSKYRIRSYNNNSSVIKLERKDKKNGYTHKKSCFLNMDEYNALLDEDTNFYISEKPLLNELNLKRNHSWASPSVIIEYEREAYLYEVGNVRVTFDRHIMASKDIQHFFSQKMFSVPVIDDSYFVLEVKYDQFLEKSIAEALDIRHLQRITFSKFYLGTQKLSMREY